jgi:uncharacterized membrane protein (DUF485 family)
LNPRVLEGPPRFLLRKLPVALRISPWLLITIVVYFGLIYLLTYSPLAVKHPVIDYSMSLRPALGFEPVRSTIVVHTCTVFDDASQYCPPSSSDYVFAVLVSWSSPLMRPKLSITFILLTLGVADALYERLRFVLRRMTGSARVGTFGRDAHPRQRLSSQRCVRGMVAEASIIRPPWYGPQ